MIIDFRNSHDLITPSELSIWKSVGATTILFTLHHEESFGQLDYFKSKTDMIRSYGLKPGIYTGFLGIERSATAQRLDAFSQRHIDGSPVYYDPRTPKPWGRMFCPNSSYLSDYRLPLVQKAVEVLDIEFIYFDLPWFKTGACYCDSCKDGLMKRLRTKGFKGTIDSVLEESTDRYSPLSLEHLDFKQQSLRQAMERATSEINSWKRGVEVFFNMGSHLSNIDNPHSGSWLYGLQNSDFGSLVEFNPFAPNVKTPTELVAAAMKLCSTSKTGRIFQTRISDDGDSKYYSPRKLEKIYRPVRKNGSQLYLSYATSNLNEKDRLSAPLIEYLDLFERMNIVEKTNEKPVLTVVHSPLSYVCSIKDSVPQVPGEYSPQGQYLYPLWDLILNLAENDVPYAMRSIHDIGDAESPLVLPRTVAMWDADLSVLNKLYAKGARIISIDDFGLLNGRGEKRSCSPIPEIKRISGIQELVQNILKEDI